MASTPAQKLPDYVRKNSIIRACELDDLGISRVYLTRLVRDGRL